MTISQGFGRIASPDSAYFSPLFFDQNLPHRFTNDRVDMEKSMHDITDVTSHDEHLPEPEINKSPEHAAIVADTEEEHNLTFSQICKNHPMLIWWAFFYAMSAVGW